MGYEISMKVGWERKGSVEASILTLFAYNTPEPMSSQITRDPRPWIRVGKSSLHDISRDATFGSCAVDIRLALGPRTGVDENSGTDTTICSLRAAAAPTILVL